MLLIENTSAVYTMSGSNDDPLGTLVDGAIVCQGERIHWVGPRSKLPADIKITHRIDAQGGCVLPGLIDCHTHLPFAGHRSEEFALRAKGASYAEIMQAGGGIVHTMKSVRNASEAELVQGATRVLDDMLRRGVTTIEAKSGYGLSTQSELKSLSVHQTLNQNHPIDVYSTFLGAHALPPEYKDNIDGYVELVIKEMLPAVKEQGIARFCDIFIEKGAFTLAHGENVLGTAKDLGLFIKVHAEQLSHSGGAQLAIEFDAVSAGHLEYVSDDDLKGLAAKNIICEVLSTAQVFLNSPQAIPGQRMREAGVPIAVATDYNPGSAMCSDLQLAAGLAITQCGLHAEEALLGITRYAAAALALKDRGIIENGRKADCIILETPSPYSLVYHWAYNPIHQVIKNGVLV